MRKTDKIEIILSGKVNPEDFHPKKLRLEIYDDGNYIVKIDGQVVGWPEFKAQSDKQCDERGYCGEYLKIYVDGLDMDDENYLAKHLEAKKLKSHDA